MSKYYDHEPRSFEDVKNARIVELNKYIKENRNRYEILVKKLNRTAQEDAEINKLEIQYDQFKYQLRQMS